MATFTPQMQEDPEGRGYGHYEGRAEKPQPDESGKFRGAGIKLAEGLATEGVQTAKNYLETSINKNVNVLQQERINQLNQDLEELQSGEARIVSPLAGKGPSTAVSGPNPPQLLNMPIDAAGHTEQEENPWQLKEIPNQVHAIVGAQKSGKISPVYYDMALNRLAQQYRTQWPGFVDYVDEQFSKATGRSIANKTISALQSTINTYTEARNSASGKVWTLLGNQEYMSNLPDGVRQSLIARATVNPQDPTLMGDIINAAAPGIIAEHRAQQRERQLQMVKTAGEVDDAEAKRQRRDAVEHVTQSALERSNAAIWAIGSHGRSVMDMKSIAPAVAGGGYEARPEEPMDVKGAQAAQMAHEYSMAKQDALNKAQQDMLRFGVTDPEDIEKINKAVAEPYDLLINSMSRDYSDAQFYTKAVEADNAATAYNMNRKYPSANIILETSKLFPRGTPAGDRFNELTRSAVDKATNFKDFFGAIDMIGASILTDKGSVAEAITSNPNITPEVRRDVMAKIISTLGAKELPPDANLNMFKQWLQPGIWSALQQDYTDPVTGEHVYGSWQPWSMLFTDPKIRNRARELGIEKEYNGALNSSLSGEMWHQTFERVNNLEAMPWVYVGYDQDLKQFVIRTDPSMDKNIAMNMGGERSYMNQIKDAQSALNAGMRALVAESKAHGDIDPEMEALKMFVANGLNLGAAHGPRGAMPSMPQRFMDAFVTAQRKKKEEEEEQFQEITKKTTEGLVKGF
jgi:hypothetical protein